MKKQILLFILLIIIGASFYGVHYYQSHLEAVNTHDETPHYVTIPSGTSPNGIGRLLHDQGLIQNQTVYQLYLRLNQLGADFKAGEYEMNPSMTLPEIAQLLNQGSNVSRTRNITLQEGLTLEEALAALVRQTELDLHVFMDLAHNVSHFAEDYPFLQSLQVDSLEGYLYPNTYNIYLDATEEDILRRLLDGFENIYHEVIENNLPEGMDLNQLMSMAAIIEGEAQWDSERPLVASVFYNRIQQGWRLESCATVQYVLGERKSVLTYDDLAIESPYNTYIHWGLPPSPINSPGKASIEAAVNPDDTQYLFFLAKGDGSHYFTDDYNDFLRAKDQYIRN